MTPTEQAAAADALAAELELGSPNGSWRQYLDWRMIVGSLLAGIVISWSCSIWWQLRLVTGIALVSAVALVLAIVVLVPAVLAHHRRQGRSLLVSRYDGGMVIIDGDRVLGGSWSQLSVRRAGRPVQITLSTPRGALTLPASAWTRLPALAAEIEHRRVAH